MLSVNNVSLQFGSRKLFSGVNLVFQPGHCYGLIGANGSGKSTFLKILSGAIETTTGDVSVLPGKRISILKQDQLAYDECLVLTTVIMGHKRLHEIMAEKEALYAKVDFTDADGMRMADLDHEFSELDGWNAESNAAKLLSCLGISEAFCGMPMKQLEAGQKFRVLLAQALFGNPDILLLDEPTNHLDVDTSMWLEEFLCEFENCAIVVSHDRHFLDKVCTYIADIDYGKIQLYPGNFTFWYESSQLALKQRQEANKKTEESCRSLSRVLARTRLSPDRRPAAKKYWKS
jgi:ATPase subunit of ABC transporter with duplicated ATPase domains